MTSPSTTNTTPTANSFSWSAESRKLGRWLRVYLAMCGIWFATKFLPHNVPVWYLVEVVELAALGLFFGCLVYAYRVQSKLKAAGFARTGAWAIVVAGFLSLGVVDELGYTNGGWLLFWLLGFAISWFVLRAANKVATRLGAATPVPPTPRASGAG